MNVQVASTLLPPDFALMITVQDLSRNFCVVWNETACVLSSNVAGGASAIAVIIQVVAALTDQPRRPRRPVIPPIGETFGAMGMPPPPPADGEPPAGSTVGSMAVVALVGFILAKALFRR